MDIHEEASDPRRTKLMLQLFQQPATVYLAFYTSAFIWLSTSVAFVLGYWMVTHFPESVVLPGWLQGERIERAFATVMEFGWLPFCAIGFLFWFQARKKTLHPAMVEYIPLAALYWNVVVLGAFVWNWMVDYPAFRLGIPWILSLAIGAGFAVPIFLQNFRSWLFVYHHNVRLTRVWFTLAHTWVVIYLFLLFAAFLEWWVSNVPYSWFWIDFQRILDTLQVMLFLGLALHALGGFLSYMQFRKKFLNPTILVFSYLVLFYLNILSISVLVWNLSNFGQSITVFVPWWISLILFGVFYVPLNYRYVRLRFDEFLETKRKVQYGS